MRCFLNFENEKILILTTKTGINNRLPMVYVVCNKKDNIIGGTIHGQDD